jgi:hypothetical protein
MKAYDIVAYTYKAETLCDSCTLNVTNAWLEADGVKVPYLITEDALNAWATSIRLDREDEYAFDSDDFPKVVFAAQIEDVENCGQCGEEILP